jgi:nucleotide-binding universal stress UspA family protein
MLNTAAPIQRIFHPSDLSNASNLAFDHALRLAITGKCDLTILHTGSVEPDNPWAEFPRVRRTLEQWKLLPPDSPKEAILKLGLNVHRVVLPDADPVTSMVDFLSKHPHDLIVLATHQYDGLKCWMHEQVAEPISRKAGEMTLFIPHEGEGFVSQASGEVRLDSVLVPVDHLPDPQVAIESATALVESLGCREADATLLYVGDRAISPEVRMPGNGALKWRWTYRDGNVEKQILQAADEYNAGLIVMATQGHHGFLDALRGSTTERIVRHAKCPVLAAPVHRAAEPACGRR